jgi:hypothetical protein
MKLLLANCIGLAWLFVLTCGVGCNRSGSSTPPPALSAEELPGALEKAFAKAKPELKELAGLMAGAVRTRDYPNAYLGLQTLAGKPGLNKEQQRIMASALVTVNSLLQSAQSQGDAKAAQTLNYLRQNK